MATFLQEQDVDIYIALRWRILYSITAKGLGARPPESLLKGLRADARLARCFSTLHLHRTRYGDSSDNTIAAEHQFYQQQLSRSTGQLTDFRI